MLTKRKVKWTTEYLVSHGNCLAVAVRNDCLIDIYESGLIFHVRTGRSRRIKAKFVVFIFSNPTRYFRRPRCHTMIAYSQAIKSVESGDRSLRQAPQKLILSDEMLKKPSLLLQIKYKNLRPQLTSEVESNVVYFQGCPANFLKLFNTKHLINCFIINYS